MYSDEDALIEDGEQIETHRVSSSAKIHRASEARWPLIVNLSNSIIGVSILTMPFCMRECGIVLGILLIFLNGILTRITCFLLLSAANQCRKRSYEDLALYCYGSNMKKVIEIFTVAFLMSTMTAYFVVIGDLGPHTGERAASAGRVPLMIFSSIIITPISLIREIRSLTAVSTASMAFYTLFVFRLTLSALPFILGGSYGWINDLKWWNTSGILRVLPIFSLALSCQTQLFITQNQIENPTPMKIDSIVNGAISLTGTVYCLVGILGYITFSTKDIHGDILLLFEDTILTQILRLGFLLSVAVSFPLMVFPCRSSIFTMFFSKPGTDTFIAVIPEPHFKFITIVLIQFTLLVAIFIPNVEFVLGLTGSTIGSSLCIILPALMFLKVATPTDQKKFWRDLSQAVIAIGVFILIACTFSTIIQNRSINTYLIENPVQVENLQPQNEIIAESEQKGLQDAGKIISELKQLQVEHKELLNEEKKLIDDLKKHESTLHNYTGNRTYTTVLLPADKSTIKMLEPILPKKEAELQLDKIPADEKKSENKKR